MNKIINFISTWAFTIILCIVALIVLFALGCSIYTAVTNPFVGIIGIIGNVASLAVFGWAIYKNIKKNT